MHEYMFLGLSGVMTRIARHNRLAELHGDLFGHHACPSEEAVLSVSVDETIVNVIKDPTKGRASPVTVTTDTPSPRGQSVQQRGFH